MEEWEVVMEVMGAMEVAMEVMEVMEVMEGMGVAMVDMAWEWEACTV